MNRNSALLWFPKIKAVGLPVPQTVFVPYSHPECLSIFDGGESAEFDRLVIAIREACGEIGYPAFIRSDLTSAKHSGPSAYKITGTDTVIQPLMETIEDNEMKLWLERDGPLAIMVRQFLVLPAPFTAFGGLPISHEWRLFADADQVLCWHPYWPEEALKDYGDGLPSDWRDQLALMHREPSELPGLKTMAVQAARVCGGGIWSVDFCQDDNDKFWLLDMAVAENSYHWPGCQEKKAA